jgi:hypothetical protein
MASNTTKRMSIEKRSQAMRQGSGESARLDSLWPLSGGGEVEPDGADADNRTICGRCGRGLRDLPNILRRRGRDTYLSAAPGMAKSAPQEPRRTWGDGGPVSTLSCPPRWTL